MKSCGTSSGGDCVEPVGSPCPTRSSARSAALRASDAGASLSRCFAQDQRYPLVCCHPGRSMARPSEFFRRSLKVRATTMPDRPSASALTAAAPKQNNGRCPSAPHKKETDVFRRSDNRRRASAYFTVAGRNLKGSAGWNCAAALPAKRAPPVSVSFFVGFPPALLVARCHGLLSVTVSRFPSR